MISIQPCTIIAMKMHNQSNESILAAATQLAYECEHCADACLGTMPECARLCCDCALMRWTIASYISHASQFIP